MLAKEFELDARNAEDSCGNYNDYLFKVACDIPEQQNMYDCGIFVMKYMKAAVTGTLDEVLLKLLPYYLY